MRGGVLIATLGVNPQVVTITLDLLTQRGYSIAQIVTVYTSNPPIDAALVRLDAEFRRMGTVRHTPVKVFDAQTPITDTRTEADVMAFFKTLYQSVKQCKQAGQQIHLMIAGGRKVMSAYALVVAQLLFGREDQVWHLFSDAWERRGDDRMHLDPNDKAELIPVPVIRWSTMTPAAAELALADDPWQALNQQESLQQQEKDARLRAFLWGLSRVQRQVLQLLAEGLDNPRIAQRRGTSINTITKQLSLLYEKWRIFFNQPEKSYVRDQLVAEFAGYLARNGTEAIINAAPPGKTK